MKKILSIFAILSFLLLFGSLAVADNTCEDTDGGENIYEAGEAIGQGEDGEGRSSVDNCVFLNNPDGVLMEAICDGNNPTHIPITCPSETPYCRYAVCTSDNTPVCKDTDRGMNPNVRGTVHEARYEEPVEHTDYCEYLDTKQPARDEYCSGENCGLREYYCTDPYRTTTYKDVKCSECKEGVCIGYTEEPLIATCENCGAPTPKPICGNGICERGEGTICSIPEILCVTQPCPPVETKCYTKCPQDCEKTEEHHQTVKLNQKFKLGVRDLAKVADYRDMVVTFLDVSEGGCREKTVSHLVRAVRAFPERIAIADIGEEKKEIEEISPIYEEITSIGQITETVSDAIPEPSITSGGGVGCKSYTDEYGCTIVKCSDGTTRGSCPGSTEDAPVISAYPEFPSVVTRCKEGQVIAKFEFQLNHKKEYLSIRLGEKKEIFGITFSFLDYSPKHQVGVFLVSKGIVADCPEECICNVDGTMDCPTEECKLGYTLCPDGKCRKDCGYTEIEGCKFGCLFDKSSCLPIGTRAEGDYCSIYRDLKPQKGSGDICENDFECKTNSCLDSQCTEPGFWKKIYKWLSRMF